MSIKVRIITPSMVAFEGTVKEIRAPGFHGEFGVLDGHEQYLTVSTPGRVTIYGDEEKSWIIGSGFIEVGADLVTVLTDLCEQAGTADPEKTQEDLKNAELALLSAQEGSVEWAEAERMAAICRARLG